MRIYTAAVPAAQAALTVSGQTNQDDLGLKVFAFGGADLAIPVGQVYQSATNDGSGSITPTLYSSSVAGTWTVGGATEFSANGTLTSTDVGEAFKVYLNVDGIALRKAAPTATAGTPVTLHASTSATSGRNWAMAAIEVRPAPGSAPVLTPAAQLAIVRPLPRSKARPTAAGAEAASVLPLRAATSAPLLAALQTTQARPLPAGKRRPLGGAHAGQVASSPGAAHAVAITGPSTAEAALPVSGQRRIGAVVEAGDCRPLLPSKSRLLAPAAHLAGAGAVRRGRGGALAPVPVSSSVVPFGARKDRALPPAGHTSTAAMIRPLPPQFVPLLPALTAGQARPLGRPSAPLAARGPVRLFGLRASGRAWRAWRAGPPED
ncbi:hypothetical protein D5H75_38545 [Bailinhaonella thermotolerans]|uniref:Uncharacterized protein n=1 Tax=Bailinhaonella thermotolerans TaxID=1070861 RepID=A0A3A4A1S9_9ACTN|nr:hypothetical protein D5H75_38545 [Bailinhaonella thermotolerans]